jgi:prepilin peptidase CpaA
MILLGIIILMFRLAGGGDVKLLIAAGSLKGPEFIIPILLYTALAGGVLSVMVLLRQRRVGSTLKNMPLSIYTSLLVKSAGGSSKGNCIPYGIAIAAGSIAALVRTWVKQAA